GGLRARHLRRLIAGHETGRVLRDGAHAIGEPVVTRAPDVEHARVRALGGGILTHHLRGLTAARNHCADGRWAHRCAPSCSSFASPSLLPEARSSLNDGDVMPSYRDRQYRQLFSASVLRPSNAYICASESTTNASPARWFCALNMSRATFSAAK